MLYLPLMVVQTNSEYALNICKEQSCIFRHSLTTKLNEKNYIILTMPKKLVQHNLGKKHSPP